MLDFIDEDNGENGEEDDLLTHIENLWQNQGGNGANHIVLGHQLNLGPQASRGYQISVLGSGGVLGQGAGADGSLPPHPLSVSAVHPLLVHHTDSLQGGSSSGTTNGTSLSGVNQGGGMQITGLGLSSTGIGSAISPILRTMRQNFQVQQQQQQQQQQARPLRNFF